MKCFHYKLQLIRISNLTYKYCLFSIQNVGGIFIELCQHFRFIIKILGQHLVNFFYNNVLK